MPELHFGQHSFGPRSGVVERHGGIKCKLRHQKVLDHRHSAKRSCDLEGPPDPTEYHFMRSQAIDALAAEHDGSSCSMVVAADNIDERCLARAVWAYKSADLRAVDNKTDLLENRQSAEMHAKILH